MENNQQNSEKSVQGQTFAQPQGGPNPFTQQPTQPQMQSQPFNQQTPQPQSFNQQPVQPQMQNQSFNQQASQPQSQPFTQQALNQSTPPKVPMPFEKRALLLAISLLAMYLLIYEGTSLFAHITNQTASGFQSIFEVIYSTSRYIIKLSALIIGVLLFVPQWNKKLLEYVNTRLMIISIATTHIILASLSFIVTIMTSVRTHARNTQHGSSGLEYTNSLFSSSYIFIPIFIGFAVFAIILALPLQSHKLQKDRFSIGLLSALATVLGSGLILFIFSFFGY